jgi:hypothetical protein
MAKLRDEGNTTVNGADLSACDAAAASPLRGRGRMR